MRLALALCVVLSVPVGAQETDSTRAWGRRYTDWFFNDQLNDLYAHFVPKLQTPSDSAKLVTLRHRVSDQLGRKQLVVSEEIGQPMYTQTITVEKIAQLVSVRMELDTTGRIGGFVVLPSPATEAVSAFMNYRTKTTLRLPFTGTWVVLWGGRTLTQNRHASSADQRFAYDFVAEQGKPCAGLRVLAPGAGAVVDVVDSVAEASDDNQQLGNYVVIDHGNGEFSFLAHLRHGSVAVKRGEQVAAGAPVGQCGSHLHYHMQSTPSFMVGAGMPAQFQHYVADGKPVDRGEPTRGQSIRPAP